MLTIQAALRQGSKLFEDGAVIAPRLTAEVLLCHALGREKSYLFAHPEEELSENAWIHYGRYLHERLQGKPTQYITGHQEFYGREFRVTPDVLIPRPETEHVVERALALVQCDADNAWCSEMRGAAPLSRNPTPRSGLAGSRDPARSKGTAPHEPQDYRRSALAPRVVVDAGCGSGAIAATLQLECGAQVYATDISEAAIRVAAANARRLGARVDFMVCDLLAGLAARSVDLLVSNPPYVPYTDAPGLQCEVVDFEPHIALFGGASGYEIYERLVAEAPRVLRRGGWLVMELGYRSEARVRGLLTAWSDIDVQADLAGLPRVISARWQP